MIKILSVGQGEQELYVDKGTRDNYGSMTRSRSFAMSRHLIYGKMGRQGWFLATRLSRGWGMDILLCATTKRGWAVINHGTYLFVNGMDWITTIFLFSFKNGARCGGRIHWRSHWIFVHLLATLTNYPIWWRCMWTITFHWQSLHHRNSSLI